MGKVTANILVADEVWIATALLHREQPGKADFSLKEIEARLIREDIAGGARPGVMPHISRHCVANAPRDRGVFLFDGDWDVTDWGGPESRWGERGWTS